MMMTTKRRRPMSARGRILAWILFTVAIALVVLISVTGRAVLTNVDSEASVELGHETEKFRQFATLPDPSTGTSYFTVEQLLTSHLQHNVPEHTEAFFSIINGQADRRSIEQPPARLDRDPKFVSRVAASDQPTWGRVDTSAGKAMFASIPVQVRGDPNTGHLVIVEFLGEADAEARSVIWTMIIVGGAALLLAGAVGWFISGRVLAPVRDVREAAARISDTDLDRRIEVSGKDDIAELARTFNTMLDRLQSAFDGQRRFLDDAGHELRTPITVIRGHLDVMSDDPQDREETIHLVKDELRRMSRLVDDLMMLARSERPGFLIRSRIDLAELVIETFTKATALAPRQWSIDETPESLAYLDEQRMTQALLQLAANAVNHTTEEDAIAMGGAVVGQTVRLWVRDGGSGISEEDIERIFDRFARGSEESRGRGSGLGLAIVSRIATAHGGRVTVESTEGEGSIFTISIPLVQSKEDG